jgi:hypothetical protein
MSTDKKINGQDILQFIRVLAELNACGLTDEQVKFLEESADIQALDLKSYLDKAEEAYELIKDLIRQGYKIISRPLTDKEILEAYYEKDKLVQGIIFITTDELECEEHTDELNDLMDTIVLNDKGTLGGDYGLTYRPLIDNIPFWIEGGLNSDLIEEIESSKEEEE